MPGSGQFQETETMNYETCAEIETAVAGYFDPRRSLIVPNVWWGLGLNHECDVFVLTKSGFAYEVEIKTSRADLKRDLLKRTQHASNLIRKLYFALPQAIEASTSLIPERAGILIVGTKGHVFKRREAQINPTAKPLRPETQLKLAHLGTMRIWALKRDLRTAYATHRPA